MRPLFAYWHEFAARLSTSQTIALFLDFDGTLAPFRARPEQVRLLPGVRRTLAALTRSSRWRLWVISARRRADIRARVGVPAIRYLGLYGWERGFLPSPRGGPVAPVKEILAASLPHHPAIWIEDKQYSLAVHYRGAPDAVRRIAIDRVYRAAERWRGQLRVAPGECIREILPRGLADKGAAVRRELAGLNKPAFAVYIGDGHSDEAAFAALGSRGLGIHVGGPSHTRAQYRVANPEQVHHFLEKLRTELL